VKRLVVIGVVAVLAVAGWLWLGQREAGERIRPSYQHRSLEAGDESGRSVVIEDQKVYYHRAKGVVATEIGGERQIVSVIGRFAGFEEMAGSQDKLLKLSDIETGEELPVVRLVFEAGQGALRQTNWRVVDLSQAERIEFQ